MKQQKPLPPNRNDWKGLPLDYRIYVALRIFFIVQWPQINKIALYFLNRVDLWFFPPLAFLSTYLVTSRYFPLHPIKIFAVLATAFMASTLTLFLIRPRRWKKTRHWVKS